MLFLTDLIKYQTYAERKKYKKIGKSPNVDSLRLSIKIIITYIILPHILLRQNVKILQLAPQTGRCEKRHKPHVDRSQIICQSLITFISFYIYNKKSYCRCLRGEMKPDSLFSKHKRDLEREKIVWCWSN